MVTMIPRIFFLNEEGKFVKNLSVLFLNGRLERKAVN